MTTLFLDLFEGPFTPVINSVPLVGTWDPALTSSNFYVDSVGNAGSNLINSVGYAAVATPVTVAGELIRLTTNVRCGGSASAIQFVLQVTNLDVGGNDIFLSFITGLSNGAAVLRFLTFSAQGTTFNFTFPAGDFAVVDGSYHKVTVLANSSGTSVLLDDVVIKTLAAVNGPLVLDGSKRLTIRSTNQSKFGDILMEDGIASVPTDFWTALQGTEQI